MLLDPNLTRVQVAWGQDSIDRGAKRFGDVELCGGIEDRP